MAEKLETRFRDVQCSMNPLPRFSTFRNPARSMVVNAGHQDIKLASISLTLSNTERSTSLSASHELINKLPILVTFLKPERLIDVNFGHLFRNKSPITVTLLKGDTSRCSKWQPHKNSLPMDVKKENGDKSIARREVHCFKNSGGVSGEENFGARVMFVKFVQEPKKEAPPQSSCMNTRGRVSVMSKVFMLVHPSKKGRYTCMGWYDDV